MNRSFRLGLILGLCLMALALGGCSSSPSGSAANGYADAQDQPARSDEEARQAVAQRFAVSKYVVSDFIPSPGAESPPAISPKKTVKVGFSWVINDEMTPWFVGIEKGFFADEGLDLQLIAGGPDRDNLGNLLGNRIDIYDGSVEAPLFVITSRTGADLKMIGAVMKQTPVGFIGLDRSIPKGQRSTKQLGVNDLKGRTIGLDTSARYLANVVANRLGLKTSDFNLVTAGATPDALMGGAVDYYTGFSENQPRILERNGYRNWTFFPFSQIGYQDYFDVSTVTADFYKNHPDVLACYVFALKKSLQYIIDHPDEAADIAVRHSSEFPVTKEEALWRIKKDIPLYLGDGSGLLSMDPNIIANQASLLYQYHQLELPTDKVISP